MTIVIDLSSHQWLALIGAGFIGYALAWLIHIPRAVLRVTDRINAQWWAQSERDYQARKEFQKL